MKRTTHLDIPGNFYDQHVVKTCPFCNSKKPRPERSRVSGLRAEQFGDLNFLDHGSAKIRDKTFGFLIVLNGATSPLTASPCKTASPSKVIAKIHEWMDTFQMIRRRFVQDMAFPNPHDLQAFYSTECTTRREFRQEHKHHGRTELRWVYNCSTNFSWHSWIQPPETWTRPTLARITPA